MQICMLGPNKQGSISKPEHKIWLFQKTTSYCDSKMKIWKVHIYQCMFDINKKLIFNNLGGIQPTECVSFSHTRSFRVKFKFTWLLPLTAFKGQSFTETNDDVRKKKKIPLPQPHLNSSYGLATVYNFMSWGCPCSILLSYWTLYFPLLSHLPTVHLIDYSMELVICSCVNLILSHSMTIKLWFFSSFVLWNSLYTCKLIWKLHYILRQAKYRLMNISKQQLVEHIGPLYDAEMAL